MRDVLLTIGGQGVLWISCVPTIIVKLRVRVRVRVKVKVKSQN